MAMIDHSLYPGGGFGRGVRFMIGSALTTLPGAFAMRNSSGTTLGEVIDGVVASIVDLFGLYEEAVIGSAVQASYDGYPADEESTVLIECDPFAVYKLRVSGSATVAGTALNSTAPANILTNTSADSTGLLISAAEVGTVSFAGGLLCGRTGNNAGIMRRGLTHVNSTSIATVVPFPRTIAVGDTFFHIPWSRASQLVALVTNVTEADGITIPTTGAPFCPVDFKFDLLNSEVLVSMVSRDHAYNPLS